MIMKLFLLPFYLMYYLTVLVLKIALFPILMFAPKKKTGKDKLPLWAYLFAFMYAADHI